MFLTLTACAALSATTRNEMIELWPSGNPNGWHRADQEKIEQRPGDTFKIVFNVSQPTLEIFRTSNPNPGLPIVLVCPGGGYAIEAIQHEGWEIAKMLNKAGYNAAVLKYRLPTSEDSPRYVPSLQDAQRALRLLRAWKTREGLPDGPVGIMGFSAGGHLAAVCSNATENSYIGVDQNDLLSDKPDFSVLIYPAYLDTRNEPKLPPEVKVSSGTPPAFIVTTADDGISSVSSFAYALACIGDRIPVELHLFPKGGHGYGLRSKELGLKDWGKLLVAWLGRLELVSFRKS